MFPNLNAYFYLNLEEDNILQARSFVKGQHITIDAYLVSQALDVPNRGIQHLTDYEPLLGLRVVLDNPDFINAFYKLRIVDLDPPTLVLHLLITHSILPRSGSHADISYSDLGLLYYIKSRTPIDFPTN